ncbi:Fe-S cluster assembly protein SufB [Weissella diestrammenae]|uniref:Fe-S cluster assembly protein SufB n=1 Tax=Weissella diestrammenae TaxID=1162633 RepID=A0A7G9T4X4_9LACO|nr:Fe-S cluster assembly protein SufB [Weissella diestrammenae]MCM0582866.1 Fe-S cluster assembly protein SufB [Weissella diestrammenae]QNN75149.1 Fe-S cluster assembly protein SufB [Weissella diestrammenae]
MAEIERTAELSATRQAIQKKAADELQYADDIEPVFSTGKGLSVEVIKAISAAKNEPEWMLEYRLVAYEQFLKMPMPAFGPDLSALNFDEIYYYNKPARDKYRDWNDVPEAMKTTFERLGVPEAERQWLAGSSAQYESEVVYSRMKAEFEALGIIFMDTDSALQQYPELVREYFGTIVKIADNKMTALNAAVWSGGTFIYVPKGVHVNVPIQSYFRINTTNEGQFERTLIIVDEGAHVDYVEGCSAPMYSGDALHAAVVEVVVKKDAYCRYTTIQNWSDNVYSLETKRAYAYRNATMEWIDGNFGSKVTMKYPAVYLQESGARGTMLSIAVAGAGIHLDSGARMIHNAPNTSSSIISKSIAHDGGKTDYRGDVRFVEDAIGATAHVECDTILMDAQSAADTIPYNQVNNGQVTLEHEAKVSRLSAEQLNYFMSRGISERDATAMIIMGFAEPFIKELPMEYAVELNRLMQFEMAGSVG